MRLYVIWKASKTALLPPYALPTDRRFCLVLRGSSRIWRGGGGGGGCDHVPVTMPTSAIFTAFWLLCTTCCARMFDVSGKGRTVPNLLRTCPQHWNVQRVCLEIYCKSMFGVSATKRANYACLLRTCRKYCYLQRFCLILQQTRPRPQPTMQPKTPTLHLLRKCHCIRKTVKTCLRTTSRPAHQNVVFASQKTQNTNFPQ